MRSLRTTSWISSVRRLLSAACCLLLSALCLPTTDYWLLTTAQAADTQPPDKDQIEKARSVAREYLTAFYKHDLETVVRLTHPKLIDSFGGPIKAKQVMLGPVQRILAEGTEIIDLEFPDEPIFTHSDRNEFVLVPTKLWLINRAAHRSESIDYLFGARPVGGGEWTFIEGSRINRANVGKYFRDFPADVPFPPRRLKRL
jgi:hypothetical protein